MHTPQFVGGVGLCTLLGYLVRVEGLGSLIPTKCYRPTLIFPDFSLFFLAL
jgi:hypothetical protein